MVDSLPSPATAITLDELIALNDEMAALVRAGVPLDQGLGALGEDMPGRLGSISRMMAERMERGESLETILRDSPKAFPPVYRAVLTAGLRSGRLAAAMESVAASARRLAETRRVVLTGLLYPVIVLLLAWCVFVFFVVKIIPGILIACRDFQVPVQRLVTIVASWSATSSYWGPAVPAALLTLLAIWLLLSRRAGLLQSHRADVLLGWLPWMGTSIRAFRMATFAEILALLVESELPLPAAIRLAADAVGEPRLVRAGGEMADALEQGRPIDSQAAARAGMFPLFTWMMVAGQHRGTLLPALRRASDIYHRRAVGQAEAARIFLPVLLTVAIAGTATLAVSLTLFAPWLSLLYSLANLRS